MRIEDLSYFQVCGKVKVIEGHLFLFKISSIVNLFENWILLKIKRDENNKLNVS